MIDPSSRTATIERAKSLAKQLKADRYVYFFSPELGYVTRAQPPNHTSYSHWKVTPQGEVYRHTGDIVSEPQYVPVEG